MAVQIIDHMPDAAIHRGEPLAKMKVLAPQRAQASFFSHLSGRAWFALGTFVVHVLAIAGFMTAQRLHQVLAEPEPMEVALLETPAAAEPPPEYTPPPQEIQYALPMPTDVSYEVETITPPPVETSAIAQPVANIVVAPPVVETVEYVRAPAPVYPSESNRRRERGTVLLRVLVDAAGHPAEVRVERSSGFTRLDDAARTAVAKALFRPYEVNGVRQAAQVLIPIEFTRRG
jgi:periplasmic protein TonB